MKNMAAGSFDLVVQEFIDFVNAQTGMYIDALAGFQGNHREIKRQVHRVLRQTKRNFKDGLPTIVLASYEDPTQPDVIHSRIVRSSDYLEANRPGGSNEQQHARSILVFTFTFWELEIRPRLALCKKVEPKDIKSDVMGDLRIVRHAILHSKSVISHTEFKRLKTTAHLFSPGKEIVLSSETMRDLFQLIHQDCAKLAFDWLNIKNPPIKSEDLVGLAIQAQIRRREGAP